VKMRLVSALLFLMVAATTPAAGTGPRAVDLPETDFSELKLDAQAAQRFDELQIEIRRKRRIAPAGDLAALYGELGMLYHGYLLFDPALLSYENAAYLDPSDFRWIYLVGVVLQHGNALDGAETAFRKTLELNPGYSPALRRLGDVTLAANRLDEAEYFYDAVLRLLHHSPYALEGLGVIELRRKSYRRAVQLMETALEQAPRADRIHYSLAMAYRGLGDAESAREHLAQRGHKKPGAHDPLMMEVSNQGSSAYTHVQRGLLAAREGDYEKASGEFATAVAQDPENQDAHMALYDSLNRLGRTDEARAQLDTILELFPDNAVAHYQKAQQLDQAGDTERALVHYRDAVGSDPGYVRARYYLANKLMESGEFAEAAGHYATLRTALPDEIRILYQLGLARLASGDCDRALDPLETAWTANPRQYLILVALVRAAATCPAATAAQRQQALTLARELHGNQHTPDTTETLAMALAANGGFEEAIALQTQLVSPRGAPHLAANLRYFQDGQPAPSAWPPDSRTYRSPPPVADG